jgi:hypothetical protein
VRKLVVGSAARPWGTASAGAERARSAVRAHHLVCLHPIGEARCSDWFRHCRSCASKVSDSRQHTPGCQFYPFGRWPCGLGAFHLADDRIKRAVGMLRRTDVANYCVPKTWPNDREQHACIFGDWLQTQGRYLA